MPKASYKGTKFADSEDTIIIEGNHYFPPDSVDKTYLKTSTSTYICPWKGDCIYFDGTFGGKVQPDIAWSYPHPHAKAAHIKGYVAFDKSQVKIEY